MSKAERRPKRRKARNKRAVQKRKASAAYRKAMVEQARMEGWCHACFKREPVVGLTLCEPCRELNLGRQKAKRLKAIAEGWCNQCYCRRPPEGKKTCTKCRRYRAAWVRKTRRAMREAVKVKPIAVLTMLATGAKEQHDITAELGVSHRNTLRTLAIFRSRGLIERIEVPSDGGPAIYARLTPAGRDEVNRMAERMAA